MSGIEIIDAERKRQVEEEGWSYEHDDGHDHNQLVDAGDAYLRFSKAGRDQEVPRFWPWDSSWWKPSSDEVRNLGKAGALYQAELERITRNRIKDLGSVEWLTREVKLIGLMIDAILNKRNK